MKDFFSYATQSAPWARRIALTLCRKDAISGEDCSATHGAWQVLRLLGLVGSNEVHEDFFASALRQVAGPSPRVLVCGSADYFMLALVLSSFRDRGIEPRVTVLDQCETPLVLNRWYAERVTCRVQALNGDVLEFQDAEGFDAICAHAFFGYFSPAQRPRLFAAWQRLLRPAGRIVTVNTVRGPGSPEQLVFNDGEIAAFRDGALRAAQSMGPTLTKSLEMDPAGVADMAEAYARAQAIWPVLSEVELRALFEDAGLKLEMFLRSPRKPERPAGLSGPSVQHEGGYIQMVARRT